MFGVIICLLLFILFDLWHLIIDLFDRQTDQLLSSNIGQGELTSKASSRSGAGPAAAIFLGAFPSASALWNATGWSRELYLSEAHQSQNESIWYRDILPGK